MENADNSNKLKKMNGIKLSLVIGSLLFIIGLLIIIGVQKILFKLSTTSIPHNSIWVNGSRLDEFFMSYVFPNPTKYVYDTETFNKIDFGFPENLGNFPEWSPDGKWVVFSKYPGIYLMQADGSHRMQVPVPLYGEQVTWSPDGNQIAYSTTSEIIVVNVECLLRGEKCTPEIRSISESTNNYAMDAPDWSPDGNQIIYSQAITTDTHHIFMINSDGKSQPTDLTLYYPDAITEPRWSPNGEKIVGVCMKWEKVGMISDICVMDSNGENLINLTHSTKYLNIHNPRWSSEGEKIAYISNFTDKAIDGICWDGCPYPTAIFIINADGSGQTHLPLEDNVVVKWFYWYP